MWCPALRWHELESGFCAEQEKLVDASNQSSKNKASAEIGRQRIVEGKPKQQEL
jgi:hypothetical protein